MAQSTLTLTLNYTGQPNVSYTLATADFPDAVTATQLLVKNGLWVGNIFYPATAILYVTVT